MAEFNEKSACEFALQAEEGLNMGESPELAAASAGKLNGSPPTAAETKPNGDALRSAQTTTHTQSKREVDLFDPKNYKKAQDPRLNPSGDPSTSGLPSTLYIGKPKRSWFIRFHPDPSYRSVLPLYTDDDSKRRDSNTYLFVPGLEIPPDLEGLVNDTLVVAAITSAGVPFLYSLRVSDSSWYESGVELIQEGTQIWVRVTPTDGGYKTDPPIAVLEEPRFPNVPFRDWLERAFSKRLITSLDHPLVRKLRGAR
jgi:hypothetical protein